VGSDPTGDAGDPDEPLADAGEPEPKPKRGLFGRRKATEEPEAPDAGSDPGPVAEQGSEPEPEAPEAPDAGSDPHPEVEQGSEPVEGSDPRVDAGDPEPERQPAPEGALSLSEASFDELRDAGLSVTQAKRVIRYREENDGFSDVNELDRVPGFPRTFLDYLKDQVVP